MLYPRKWFPCSQLYDVALASLYEPFTLAIPSKFRNCHVLTKSKLYHLHQQWTKIVKELLNSAWLEVFSFRINDWHTITRTTPGMALSACTEVIKPNNSHSLHKTLINGWRKFHMHSSERGKIQSNDFSSSGCSIFVLLELITHPVIQQVLTCSHKHKRWSAFYTCTPAVLTISFRAVSSWSLSSSSVHHSGEKYFIPI